MNKINKENLLNAGYKRYDPSAVDSDAVTDLYQKKFLLKDEVCFYINIRSIDLALLGLPRNENYKYYIESQLYLKDSKTIELAMHYELDTTIEYVEQFYNKFYDLFECAPCH